MQNSDITDDLFLRAVEATDGGDLMTLDELIRDNNRLVTNRLSTTEDGYFKDPYLLWFVADNPIRVAKLAPNIIEITKLLIAAVKKHTPDTAPYQLDYTLTLVATGRIPRECGVQIEMMDLLIDAGASPGGSMGALAHGNKEAAAHLIARGGKLTLPVAAGLERMDDLDRLLPAATGAEKLSALTVAAFYGKAGILKMLLSKGIGPNGYPERAGGFHHHATALHQAVYSGSLESVKLLVEAGADLNATDKIYQGTPLGWAGYMPAETTNKKTANRYKDIAAYLKGAR